MEISEAIKACRLRLGKSQADFAALIGVSQRQVSQWENGNERPSDLNRYALTTKAGLDTRFMHANEVENPVFGEAAA